MKSKQQALLNKLEIIDYYPKRFKCDSCGKGRSEGSVTKGEFFCKFCTFNKAKRMENDR